MRKTNTFTESNKQPLPESKKKNIANNNNRTTHDFKNRDDGHNFRPQSARGEQNPNFRSQIWDKNGYNAFKEDSDVMMRSSITSSKSMKTMPSNHRTQSEKGIAAGNKREEPNENHFPGCFKKKHDATKYGKTDLLDQSAKYNAPVEKPNTIRKRDTNIHGNAEFLYQSNIVDDASKSAKDVIKRMHTQKVEIDPNWSQKNEEVNSVGMSSGFHLVTLNVDGVNNDMNVNDILRDMNKEGH